MNMYFVVRFFSKKVSFKDYYLTILFSIHWQNPCNIMICQTLINFVMPWADGTACNAGKLPRSTCYQGVCYGPKELDEIKRDLLCMRKQLKADGKVSKKKR